MKHMDYLAVIITESKGDLYYCLGYTTMQDIEFTLYKTKKNHKSYIVYQTYDLKEVIKAIEYAKQCGIKRRKDLEPLN